jgi:hypothetical protein
MKFTDILLFALTLCSGFYAGTGFFNSDGWQPCHQGMSNATFAKFWQHVNFYNVPIIKGKVVRSFDLRLAFMISLFVLVLLAIFSRFATQLQAIKQIR